MTHETLRQAIKRAQTNLRQTSAKHSRSAGDDVLGFFHEGRVLDVSIVAGHTVPVSTQGINEDKVGNLCVLLGPHQHLCQANAELDTIVNEVLKLCFYSRAGHTD